jgi:uncharacterized protein YfaT (DUF1175 family)
MLAFLKRRQFSFALLLLFALSLTLLLSYTLGRNRKHSGAAPDTRTESNPARTEPRSSTLDSDNDGLPNGAELESFMDRENFRKWFTLIAEGQFYQPNKDWNPEQRDCAGLVRFAWRESLRRHDRPWFQKMGPGYSAIAPDVKRYQLEQGPLGEKLFRTNFGAYKDGDLSNGNFSEFADARSLKSFNTKFISRDRQNAQPGDLLFFYQPWVQKFPFHVMVFLGDSKLSQEQSNDWVVYHTGASPTDEGTVKKVRLAVLDQHPNRRWRPIESNSNFLGFYRLKILD